MSSPKAAGQTAVPSEMAFWFNRQWARKITFLLRPSVNIKHFSFLREFRRPFFKPSPWGEGAPVRTLGRMRGR